MTIASVRDDCNVALEFQQLADAIIADCDSSSFAFNSDETFNNFPVLQTASLIEPGSSDDSAGRSLKVGPFDVRPAMNREVPIGRSYQSIPERSVSRLAAYLGRDEFSLYIREVPDDPTLGLAPSKGGVWVREPQESSFRRLCPGEAVRIGRQTDIRIGGNGIEGESAYRLFVI